MVNFERALSSCKLIDKTSEPIMIMWLNIIEAKLNSSLCSQGQSVEAMSRGFAFTGFIAGAFVLRSSYVLIRLCLP